MDCVSHAMDLAWRLTAVTIEAGNLTVNPVEPWKISSPCEAHTIYDNVGGAKVTQ